MLWIQLVALPVVLALGRDDHRLSGVVDANVEDGQILGVKAKAGWALSWNRNVACRHLYTAGSIRENE